MASCDYNLLLQRAKLFVGLDAGTLQIIKTQLVCNWSNSLSPVAPVATHFSVVAPASAASGVAFNFTVTALDASNNVVTGYTGTVHFTSTDGAATLPGNATLTNGTGTFSATLAMGGNQTITATDTATAITGTSGAIAVTALLLDATVAPNAFAAYSVRLLRTAYAGSCITVQRSSDNTQASFGFVNGVLDTAGILAFAGASANVWVVKWFDQSGNTRDAAQTTTALCPLIAQAGVIVTGSNGLPALQWNNAQSMPTPSVTLATALTAYGVGFRNWNTARYCPFYEASNYSGTQGFAFLTTGTSFADWQSKYFIAVGNGFNGGVGPRAGGSYGALVDGTWHLIDCELSATTCGVWLDSNLISTFSGTIAIPSNTSTILIGGNPSTGDFWDNKMEELVIYNAAHAPALQTTVRNNINAAYHLF